MPPDRHKEAEDVRVCNGDWSGRARCTSKRAVESFPDAHKATGNWKPRVVEDDGQHREGADALGIRAKAVLIEMASRGAVLHCPRLHRHARIVSRNVEATDVRRRVRAARRP
jgi:hypothetical protein